MGASTEAPAQHASTARLVNDLFTASAPHSSFLLADPSFLGVRSLCLCLGLLCCSCCVCMSVPLSTCHACPPAVCCAVSPCILHALHLAPACHLGLTAAPHYLHGPAWLGRLACPLCCPPCSAWSGRRVQTGLPRPLALYGVGVGAIHRPIQPPRPRPLPECDAQCDAQPMAVLRSWKQPAGYEEVIEHQQLDHQCCLAQL